MRDKTHNDFIERWAIFVRENPVNIWKPKIKQLIDSQIIIANRFYSNLLKTKKGTDKMMLLKK